MKNNLVDVVLWSTSVKRARRHVLNARLLCLSLAIVTSGAILAGQQALADGRGPAWSMHVIDSGLSGGDGVRLLDVDNDGDMDLAVGWEQSGVSRLYLNPGPGPLLRSNWPAIDCGAATNVEDAMMADIDGDGRVDVMSCTEGRQWSDPGDNVYGAGRIGLRNMGHSHIVSYGRFKVWAISPK